MLNPAKVVVWIFEICSLAADVKAVFFTDDKTEGHMGVSELLLATTINGILFSVLSGQPLLMIGLSGTVLVFEEELYKVWILGQNVIGSDKIVVRSESRYTRQFMQHFANTRE